jgi:hypothetical protein
LMIEMIRNVVMLKPLCSMCPCGAGTVARGF